MAADPESSPAGETTENEATESVAARGVLDAAPSGRSKCRACSQAIAKGAWRVGEIAANPFAEGETTYWFHAHCAAERRAEVWQHAVDEASAGGTALPEDVLRDRELAARGCALPRLTRLTLLERAPSGRARCRQCREPIAKAGLRIALSIFHAGRFDPLGFTHLACVHAYVSERVTEHDLARLMLPLDEELQREVRLALEIEPESFPS